jgi:hypothetical protein
MNAAAAKSGARSPAAFAMTPPGMEPSGATPFPTRRKAETTPAQQVVRNNSLTLGNDGDLDERRGPTEYCEGRRGGPG